MSGSSCKITDAAMRVIPIKPVVGGAAAIAEEARVRLERAGFMRMMLIGEPRLSEFVKAYEALGYEVEAVQYRDESTGEVVQDCATIYIRRAGGVAAADSERPSAQEGTGNGFSAGQRGLFRDGGRPG